MKNRKKLYLILTKLSRLAIIILFANVLNKNTIQEILVYVNFAVLYLLHKQIVALIMEKLTKDSYNKFKKISDNNTEEIRKLLKEYQGIEDSIITDVKTDINK